ncbi:RTA1-like protein [Mycena albidolilacea]|uniref:RTA1-like protein n=1 Tax=Mycena albidolilacea TaxID=1033008 RepID=A0AAD7A341_9AGAR|nr:RTA1-like protein [Mycena albidolilacea]
MSDTTGLIGGDENEYGYNPSEGVAIGFIVLFSLSTLLHAVQATNYRMWWLFPTACLCGIGELAGWVARFKSASDPTNGDANMAQIVATIISPTPLIAVNFVLMSRIVQRLGVCYSWLSARWYTIIFLTCDIVALVVQGGGGGIAASADDGDRAAVNMGSNIMLAGIVFQLVAIIVYTLVGAEFLRRYTRDLPVRAQPSLGAGKAPFTPRLRLMVCALGFSTLVLFIRSIYRVVELAGGWNGKVIQTQAYFIWLDGGMVTLAIYTMNLCHPGLLLAVQDAGIVDEKDNASAARLI